MRATNSPRSSSELFKKVVNRQRVDHLRRSTVPRSSPQWRGDPIAGLRPSPSPWGPSRLSPAQCALSGKTPSSSFPSRLQDASALLLDASARVQKRVLVLHVVVPLPICCHLACSEVEFLIFLQVGLVIDRDEGRRKILRIFARGRKVSGVGRAGERRASCMSLGVADASLSDRARVSRGGWGPPARDVGFFVMDSTRRRDSCAVFARISVRGRSAETRGNGESSRTPRRGSLGAVERFCGHSRASQRGNVCSGCTRAVG